MNINEPKGKSKHIFGEKRKRATGNPQSLARSSWIRPAAPCRIRILCSICPKYWYVSLMHRRSKKGRAGMLTGLRLLQIDLCFDRLCHRFISGTAIWNGQFFYRLQRISRPGACKERRARSFPCTFRQEMIQYNVENMAKEICFLWS